MGDMADYVNELIEIDYELLLDYRCGRINDLEAYDLGLIDEFGAEYYYGSPKNKSMQCKYCKMNDLEWVQTTDGWRLREKVGGQIHSCSSYHK